MKAVAWHGVHDVRVDTVPDPAIREDTDAIIRVTLTGICGSDLNLYELLGPFSTPGTSSGMNPSRSLAAPRPASSSNQQAPRAVVISARMLRLIISSAASARSAWMCATASRGTTSW